MIPKLEKVHIGQDLDVVELPTNTFKIDLEKGSIKGYTDGLAAMKQSVFDKLMVERYRYVIHDWDYGVELADLFGKPSHFVNVELPRRIEEALLIDERINKVTDFRLEVEDGDFLVYFHVHTKFGDFPVEGVRLNSGNY